LSATTWLINTVALTLQLQLTLKNVTLDRLRLLADLTFQLIAFQWRTHPFPGRDV
jgi:hypothetical protein